MMKENVGNRDRLMRSIAGPAVIALGITRLGALRGSPLGLAALVGGVLIVESAITRVCPVNAIAGIDTREGH
jgi:uncharacterized membrane protein